MEHREILTKDQLGKLLAELRSDTGPADATRTFNEAVIAEYRQNAGVMPNELSGPGFRFLLLTTTGAKSGKPRTIPLGFVRVSGRLIVLASKGGGETDPLWFNNLVAYPEVTVELGADTFRARAVVLERAERDEIFAKIVAKAPQFGEYQQRTTRLIPVVELVRLSDEQTPSA